MDLRGADLGQLRGLPVGLRLVHAGVARRRRRRRGRRGGRGGRRRRGRRPGVEVDPAPAPFSTRRAAVGGLITLAAYLLILVAYSVAPLTAVAPLRESAIVLASGWGALRLREATGGRDASRRIGAAGLVLVGAVLLALA